MTEYELFQALRPLYPAAEYALLGMVLTAEDRWAEAIGLFAQAVRLRPDDANAHYRLGLALGRAGRMPECVQQLAETLRLKPDHAAANSLLGTVRKRRVSKSR